MKTSTTKAAVGAVAAAVVVSGGGWAAAATGHDHSGRDGHAAAQLVTASPSGAARHAGTGGTTKAGSGRTGAGRAGARDGHQKRHAHHAGGSARSAAKSHAILHPGHLLKPGASLRSRDGHYRLVQQLDGNLVLLHGSHPVWSTRTDHHPGAYTAMQTDGNLVVYVRNHAIWASHTGKHPGAALLVQDDGNVVLYGTDDKPLWDRHITVDHLSPGQMLRPGETLVSRNREYRLVQQSDGNLVVYRGKHALWALPVPKPATGATTLMQRDGNLVTYVGKHAEWASRTHTAGAWLAMQNDGNLVIYDKANRPLWSRHLYLQVLPTGATLHAGDGVQSPNHRYHLLQQPNGDLVLFHGTHSIWHLAGKHLAAGSITRMQTDGNLVTYAPGDHPVWSSKTTSAGAYLAVQDDGNVVVYSKAHKPLWSTRTTGE